ncbi:MBG domain-containing protein [Luteolibacter sp. Populi]|uniref:MBG domain-containing protein n=1 Tax=Luteolibacter sp. Populi TaxID=3230487 RepID=UPI00346580FF
MKPSKLSLALVIALLGGALIGVARKKESAPEGAVSSGKASSRVSNSNPEQSALASGEGDFSDPEAEAFSRIPHATRRGMQDAGAPAVPLSEAEVKERKLAALEEILGAIDTFPGLPESEHDPLANYAAQLATSDAPRVQCWSPDTPAAIVYAYQHVEQKISQAGGLSLKALQIGGRWSRTAVNGNGQNTQGQPITITWSIVPDGTSIPATDAEESSAPSNLRAHLAAIYGGSAAGNPTAQPWFTVFQTTFDNLAANSGLRFVYEPNDDGIRIDGFSGSSDWGVQGTRGDIRISGHSIDGDEGTLAYAYYPDNGDMVIDTADSFYDDIGETSKGLRNVLEHELGHSLGLAHVCPANGTKLMEPFLNMGFRGSQFDDIYSHQRNYGDRLEVHGTLRDNDSALNAAPITLTQSTTSWQWLSIDDSTDTDLFSFSGTGQQQLTVRIIPSDPIQPTNPNVDTYLEGSQNFSGTCSAGTDFDPTIQQNLVLDLLGTDGTTVIASAPAKAIGETEEIAIFPLPSNGTFYIRVRGGTADRAQLYRMEALLAGAPETPPVISIAGTRVDAESNSSGNATVDPDETVRLGIALANNGTGPISNLTATLSGPAGLTLFSGTKNYGTIDVGALGEQLFTFALAGNVGQTIDLQLTLSGPGFSQVLPLPVTLGGSYTYMLLNEGFDSSASLPAGWTTSAVKTGIPWSISSVRSKSAPRSAFTPSVERNSEALLFAPVVQIPAGSPVLEFSHAYTLQAGLDGAVLEATRSGNGVWFDLLKSSEVTVESGNYNSFIADGVNSTLENRAVWSGNSAGFVTTRIRLPSYWAGTSFGLRWNLVCNSDTVALTGWNLDDVKLSSTYNLPSSFSPYLSLTASGTDLAEGAAGLALTVSTPLPLTRDMAVNLDVSGTASADDVSDSLYVVLPAGQTSVTIPLAAIVDGIPEAPETLILSIPVWASEYQALDPYMAVIGIADPSHIQTASVTLSNLATTYDGLPKAATATTVPAGLAVALTYNGAAQPPVNAGSYEVVATITASGYTGGASGTLVITSAYTAWISTFANPNAPAAAAGGDLDGDGWDNAAEYTFGTLPADPASRPQLVPVLAADTMKVLVPAAPPGVTRFAQTSTDLTTWTTDGVGEVAGGYQVSRTGQHRYIRIVYQIVN